MVLAAKHAKPYSLTNAVLTASLLVALSVITLTIYHVAQPKTTESKTAQPITTTPFKAWSNFKDCDNCPEMVIIPGGKFWFGSPEKEPLRFEEQEGPTYYTAVNGIAVSKTEILLESWQECQSEGFCNAERQPTQYDTVKNLPVNNVSWEEITNEFIPWLNRQTNSFRFRLPTEKEWEYFARAGTTSPFHNGLSISSQTANFRGTIRYAGFPPSEYAGRPMATKTFLPNGFGLHETQGNLLEWTSDCWTEKHVNYDTNLESDCELRALRGGSWLDEPNSLRFAFRRGYDKKTTAHNIGFRLVADLPNEISFESSPVTITIEKDTNVFAEKPTPKSIYPNYVALQKLTTIDTINFLSRANCNLEKITNNLMEFSCNNVARINQILGRPKA